MRTSWLQIKGTSVLNLVKKLIIEALSGSSLNQHKDGELVQNRVRIYGSLAATNMDQTVALYVSYGPPHRPRAVTTVPKSLQFNTAFSQFKVTGRDIQGHMPIL